MTKNRPVFTISPRTADDEDVNASELGEQLMRYLWKHLHMQELMTKALHWSRICGAGFVKTFWDPTLGDGADVVVGPGGQPLTDGSGRPMRSDQVDVGALTQQLGLPAGAIQSKRINQGDIRVEVRSPFQTYPDPLADTFDECEWIIEESVQSQESILRRYGVELQPDTIGNPGLIESRMGAIFMPGTGSYKGVKIREYWSKPSTQHPNGRRAVWAAKRLLFEDDRPFDPFPYVMLTGIPIPGRLWPTSIAEQLRGPQTELNKVKSQIAENRNRVGNPTILASKQAVQDPDKFADSTTMPGGIYFFDDIGSPNNVPTYLQAPPLPDYVIQEIANIEESIQEISGQHEVSSASVPPGVTAASAINLLLETDDTRLGPAVTDYETQLGKIGQKVLKLAAHYYTDARTIRIGGDDGIWQIKDFRGSMLRDNTHVEVQAGSAFPQSRAAKQAAMQDLLTQLVQSGNPPHGKDLAHYLEDMEVGGAERLIEQYTKSETQAKRENVQISQGIPLPVNDYDDDAVHIDTHQDQQRGIEYASWSPQAKQIMEAHVAAHKQRAAQAEAQQMQMQQQMQNPGQAQQAQLQGQMAQQQMAGQAQDQQTQQAQAQQQMGIQGQTAQQQLGDQAANSEQQRRHAEEQHQQKLRHAEEQHQANLRRIAAQAQQQPQQRKAA
jgi:hypothetical protein